MYISVVIGGVIVCILSLIAYFVISFVAPEWLGMSGKAAKKLEEKANKKEEQPSTERPKDFFSR